MKALRNKVLLAVALMALVGCGVGDGTEGEGTTPGAGSSTAVPASISLLVSSPQLSSDVAGAPTVTLTAVVKDSANRALKDVDVSFTADSGILTVSGEPTDENGRVTATLGTGGDPSYRQINLTAKAGSVTATNTVTVTGTTLSLNGPSSLSFGDTAPLTIFLKDSAGNGIAGRTISLTSAKGNTLSAGPYVTNASGQVTVNVTGAVGGSDTITASAIGVTGTFSFTVNAAILRFLTPSSAAEIPIGTSQKVTVEYAISGVPQVGTSISFTATRGTLSSASATTGADGRASVVISSLQSGPGLVLAKIEGGPSAQLGIEFVATEVSTVELKASPATIGTNSPGLTAEQSLITAVVRDSRNNLVKNKTVNFTIFRDASGGTLSPASAVTDSWGTANTYFTAGASPSPLGGVVIRGSVAGTNVSGDTALTVAKKPLFITLFTGQDVVKLSPNKYQKDYLALVTDASGAPVANAPVVATVTPVHYQKGYMKYDGRWVPVVTLQRALSTAPSVPACANEDGLAHNPLYDYNGILDPGEDQNGNGRLDPGNAVSVTATPTDASGHSTVSLTYARDLAYWLTVRLEAFTSSLTGSTASAEAVFTLTGAADDYKDEQVAPPGHPSPFGVSESCFVDLTVTAISASQLAVTWQKSVAAASYNVYRNGQLISNTAVNTVIDAGLAADTQYCYEIRTVDSKGQEQVFTPVTCGKTNPGSQVLPPTPSGLTVAALSPSQIRVSWNAVAGAASYRIYRNGNHLRYVASVSFDDLGLSANTNYCYAVASVDSAGTESVKTAWLCATTDAAVPAAPTNLVATAISAAQIDLSWTASAGGARGYNIYRKRSAAGEVLLGSVPGTQTSVSDMAGTWGNPTDNGYPESEGPPTAKTSYCYRVTAWNEAGYESTSSNTYCVSTP